MPIQYAPDVPDARSRLLEFYRDLGATTYASLDDLNTQARPVPPALANTPTTRLPQRLADWNAATIEAAELFHVSGDLTGLAIHSAASLPDFAMHPEVLPAHCGLVCWAAPIGGRDRPDIGTMDTIAAAWTRTDKGVWVWLFDDVECFERRDPDLGRRMRSQVGHLAEWEGMLLPWADSIHLYASDATNPQYAQAMSTVITTWLLMGQTITRSESQPLTRSDRRRLARRNHPTGPVTYIALRRTRQPDDGHEHRNSEQGRNYQHQWVVSGHWRNQYYPSVEAHRPIWIAPHLRGPEGAPLLHAEKVYTLRR